MRTERMEIGSILDAIERRPDLCADILRLESAKDAAYAALLRHVATQGRPWLRVRVVAK